MLNKKVLILLTLILFLFVIVALLLTFYVFKTYEKENILLDNPIIELPYGKIQGRITKSDTDKSYYEFREVPYASPPVGDLRFQEPIPSEKWTGIKNTTINTKICMGMPPVLEPLENEDCLYLNVFTPQLPNSTNTVLLPVYVFINGGKLMFGDPPNYDFHLLVDEDIVAVSSNYRYSALGLLSTRDGVIPANNALKDQKMVLKWVNKNIHLFGGDPTKVTIGGHSSGSTSVGYHLLDSKCKGLFRSAILQSGAALVGAGYTHDPKKMAFRLGERLSSKFDSSKNTSEDLLKLLKTFPAANLTKADILNVEDIPLWRLRSPWTFTNEDLDEHGNPVTTMRDNLLNGAFNQVPILTGLVDEELKDFVKDVVELTDEEYIMVIKGFLNFKNEKYYPQIITKLNEMYCNNSLCTHNKTAAYQLIKDVSFNIPVKLSAYLYSRYVNVYFYQFGYLGPYNGLYSWEGINKYGVKGLGNCTHCDELPLLYNHIFRLSDPLNDEDLLARKRIIKLWANFIKYTNPTPQEDPLLQNIIWPKVTQNQFKYLNIGPNLSLHNSSWGLERFQKKIEKYLPRPRYFL